MEKNMMAKGDDEPAKEKQHMTVENHRILEVGALQHPPSGWIPGLEWNIQIRARNLGQAAVRTDSALAEFFVNGSSVGNPTRFRFAGEIRPNETFCQENNTVEFPADFMSLKNEEKPVLKVTVLGNLNGSEITGEFELQVKVGELPEPHRLVKGKNVGLELMVSRFDNLSNLSEAMDFLDSVYESMAELVGQRPREGQLMVIREVPEFFAWAMAGFPILLNTTKVHETVRAFDKGRVPFGWVHEMGHNFEYGYWYMYNGPACEFQANLKLAYAVEHLFAGASGFAVLHPWSPEDRRQGYTNGRQWVDEHFLSVADVYLVDPARDWLSLSSDELLSLHLRLVRQYGWEPYRRMYRTYRELERVGLQKPQVNDPHEMTLLQMAILDRCLDADTTSICEMWKIPFSRRDIEAAGTTYRLSEHTVKG
jgi:hypothetical protein